MKKIVLGLAILMSTAHAYTTSAIAQIRTVYTGSNVTTSAWTVISSGLTDSSINIEIFDTSGETLELGTGAPGQEVVQFIIPPGGNSLLHFSIPSGVPISIKALSNAPTSGTFNVINFFK